MANPTTIYGLPAPLLSGQADGPDAVQDLNDKLETTLANLARPLNMQVADFSISSGTHTDSLTQVPLGRPVLLLVYLNCRITTASSQFCVYQIFDGVTRVTADTAVSTNSGVDIVVPVMLAVCRTFVATPTLVTTAGSSGEAVITDNIRATGFGFAWPS
jgi:hypothetical protein